MAETLYSINKRLNAVERAVDILRESTPGTGTDDGNGNASFTTNPAVRVAQTGKQASFSVDATGQNLVYQWEVSTDEGETWSNSTASTSKTNTVTINATAARSGYLYRCTVSYGSSSITSTPGRLVVLS